MPPSTLFVEIHLRGRLGAVWADRFHPLIVDSGEGGTRIHGRLPDTSAVHGTMCALRDLGADLQSLEIRREELA